MSDRFITAPPPKVELVTVWRSKEGARMMTVVADGKIQDYELSAHRIAHMLAQLAHDLTRDELS